MIEEEILFEATKDISAKKQKETNKDRKISNENFDILNDIILRCKKLEKNEAFRQLPPETNIIKKLKKFIKRAQRKSLKWYIEPICEQQSKYNELVREGLDILFDVTTVLNNKIEDIEQRLISLEKRINSK